jgi:predicted DCC family thiol-disulfide oxidoreductase YuxK
MHDIILFDGVCNFCNSAVNFVIDRDKNDRFRFVSLQSAKGQELLQDFGKPLTDFDTVLLLRGNTLYQKSDAALEVIRYLGGAWPLLLGFRVFPLFLRNAVYDLVAKNRYRIFGEANTCRLPSPEERAKFL